MIDWGFLLELLGIGLAVWLALAVLLALGTGRAVRIADEREGHRVPRRVGQWWCAQCRRWVRGDHDPGNDESPTPAA